MAEVNTVEVVGEAGRIVINASDLEEYRRQGYELASTEVTEETIIGEGSLDSGDSKTE